MNDTFKKAYEQAKKELSQIQPRYEYLLNIVATFEKLFDLDGEPVSTTDRIAVPTTPGEFEGMTLRQAILKCLERDSPLTTRQVTTMLENAAFKHGSANLWNTVNTTLDRLQKKHQLVEKDKRGWSLSPLHGAAKLPEDAIADTGAGLTPGFSWTSEP